MLGPLIGKLSDLGKEHFNAFRSKYGRSFQLRTGSYLLHIKGIPGSLWKRYEPLKPRPLRLLTAGVYPGNLIFDRAGNLYGSTLDGGAYRNGLIYELAHTGNSWVKNTLYTFTGGTDGGGPTGMLAFDQAGNLYGTTYYVSTVFELTPSDGGWSETVIYSFNRPNDGFEPVGVFFDSSGNLYGPTMSGGSFGGGIVYELTPGDGSWTETMLYNSTAPGGGGPETLVMSAAGDLFGTTEEGGGGFGNVFELTKENGGWQETDLHDFDFADGAYPSTNLVIDAGGNVIGGTVWGGNGNNCTPDDGCGVIWQITP